MESLCGLSVNVVVTLAIQYHTTVKLLLKDPVCVFLSLKVNVAELLTVLGFSIVVTLLFDLPMQEVKGILIDGGKHCTRRARLCHGLL
jgi:hypothetical protein